MTPEPLLSILADQADGVRLIVLERLPGDRVRLTISDVDDREVAAVLGKHDARSLALALLEATR